MWERDPLPNMTHLGVKLLSRNETTKLRLLESGIIAAIKIQYWYGPMKYVFGHLEVDKMNA